MNFAIFDLEWTSWKKSLERNYSFHWELQEIIQIGAIKFNSNKKFFKSKNIFVKTKKNKILSHYIQNLTGISQKKINEQGLNFSKAAKEIELFFFDVDLIFCNGDDKKVLEKNYFLNNLKKKNYFNKIKDVRPFIAKKLDINQNKIVSSELNEKINLKPLKKHDALSDCINIFNFLKKKNFFKK